MKTNRRFQIEPPRSFTNRIGLGVLVGLSVLTAYPLFRQQPQYQLIISNRSTGWAYKILRNDILIIDQPTVPGRAGDRGFNSEVQARRVGQYVLTKFRTRQTLPTITPDELHQLGVIP